MDDSETVLHQYRDVIDGGEIRVVADADVDDTYGANYEIRTERREDGGEWRTTATGFAADLEVMP
jgi:hypothetical protein